jgi:hypothetical protein
LSLRKDLNYFICLLLIIDSISCNQTIKNHSVAKLDKTQTVFGIYSYIVTGYHSQCEAVKHSIQLNTDSTFVFKVYCMSNDSALIKKVLLTGKFTKHADSIFSFNYRDTMRFEAQFLNDSTIKIVSIKNNPMNFPFKKENSLH